jgi:hypothetical protein
MIFIIKLLEGKFVMSSLKGYILRASHGRQCFSSFFLSVPFMPYNSIFILITIPLLEI